jgi:hypothetical protein
MLAPRGVRERIVLIFPRVQLVFSWWMAKKKNSAAMELGRLGGQAKVPKGFSTMDPARRAEISKKAAEKRWGKKKAGKKPAII